MAPAARSYLAGFMSALLLVVISSCDGSRFDMDKYQSYKNNGELEDAVTEWIHEYVLRRSRE
jgi:hypothetical protein